MRQPAKRISIIGGGAGAAQCALILAQSGVEVTIITPFVELDSSFNTTGSSNIDLQDLLRVRPLLLRTVSHPRITLYTNSRINNIVGKKGNFSIKGSKNPRYVLQDLCTGCGRCSEVCSTELHLLQGGRWVSHSATHASVIAANSVPSAYSIDKKGIAPCKTSCPLHINVTGFVSLLENGKVDSALSLINEAAPLAGVLGRVCNHPCENSCSRSSIDEPVFIRALHRHAADNASGGIKYTLKAPAGSRKEKIAIVGSGPAGLTAAWELARRGYSPIIFESHAVVGGMLATGIPRFRLPREVREREVKAIEELGVAIRTGITVGRDVTISDLRERGYRAFFIAIGAHENRNLNIPGEDLEGVVDSISLLFELNLQVGASPGRNMVVIGGGNSAVDSARAARRGKRNVTILYRRTAEEMTAIKEDIEEALMEGISIEYLTSPLDILGDGRKVTGVRCQRMRLGDIAQDGRRKPVPIPDSEFTMEADHVVLAIGQRPNTAQLNKKSLDVFGDATIKVDPVTLETSLPGVFAGGDCVTGPNNVADAMAAGLRAAESINRYLRGRSLTKNRVLEIPEPSEVDIDERYASPENRANMSFIPRSRRLGSFEETSTGLSPEVAKREAGRCLDCSLCSECMECVQACKLGAISHSDSEERFEIAANAIINFAPASTDSVQRSSCLDSDQISTLSLEKPGIYTVITGDEDNVWNELSIASSAAMELASDLNLKEDRSSAESANPSAVENQFDRITSALVHNPVEESRIGVFLCSCGDSISSVINLTEVSKEIEGLTGVLKVHQIQQTCTPEGAEQIAAYAAASQLNRVVVAACRCCNQDQICYSCIDRRVMCRQYLSQSLASSPDTALDFVNIREQCAWVHKDDPENATHKATEIISAMIAQSSVPLPIVERRYSIEQSVLVIGSGRCGIIAAESLAARGYSVTLVSGIEAETATGQHDISYPRRMNDSLRPLQEQGVQIIPWPDGLDLNGLPGNYKAILNYSSETVHVNAGAIILDPGEIGDVEFSHLNTTLGQNLLGRCLDRRSKSGGPQSIDLQWSKDSTVRDTVGIFIISPDATRSPGEQAIKGREIAARVWAYLAGGTIHSQDNAVSIDIKLCRGCGDCAALCPYIEMRSTDSGTPCAHVDPTLCLGCGACVVQCPTGAINQPFQNDIQINVMLDTLLSGTKIESVAR
ncbi:FAD-dependent oxidoreductase [Chloroflexota bacterium]